MAHPVSFAARRISLKADREPTWAGRIGYSCEKARSMRVLPARRSLSGSYNYLYSYYTRPRRSLFTFLVQYSVKWVLAKELGGQSIIVNISSLKTSLSNHSVQVCVIICTSELRSVIRRNFMNGVISPAEPATSPNPP